ncbi:MAG: alpha/beta fold hydrolase [Candidatus Omnitrophica bacterium]|nr:alpha/beta fold hydrolase [Candidatus Omnitrophota bacterium]
MKKRNTVIGIIIIVSAGIAAYALLINNIVFIATGLSWRIKKTPFFYQKLCWRDRMGMDKLDEIPRYRWAALREGADKRVRIPSGNLRLTGDLYFPGDAVSPPGLVILHGLSPHGRKLPLYRVLAQELRARGYCVLNLDMRGFGESEDPEIIERIDSWDYTQDLDAAVSFLRKNTSSDPERIYVLGHSFGANVALAGSRANKHISKIVAIGPSRRFTERLLKPDAPDREYFRKRFSEELGLKREVPMDIVVEMFRRTVIDSQMDYFTSETHKPLLLIDGEYEDKADLVFLKDLFIRMTEPKKLVTVAETAHYKNTVNFYGFVLYDADVMGELVNTVEEWLREDEV